MGPSSPHDDAPTPQHDSASHPAAAAPPKGIALTGTPWAEFAATDADALVLGEEATIMQALTAVWPTLPRPRFWCDSRTLVPNLSMFEDGIPVLEHFDDLELSRQQQLLDWCMGTSKRSRIIATASPRLIDLAENGEFDRRLYDLLTSVQLLLH